MSDTQLWSEYTTYMASMSPALYAHFREHVCHGLAPSADKISTTECALVPAASATGEFPYPIDLLDHSANAVRARMRDLPAGPWSMACDETAAIPLLSELKGFIVGPVAPNVAVKKGTMSNDELHKLPLAAKVKIFAHIPLSSGCPTMLGVRPGGGNKKACGNKADCRALVIHISPL